SRANMASDGGGGSIALSMPIPASDFSPAIRDTQLIECGREVGVCVLEPGESFRQLVGGWRRSVGLERRVDLLVIDPSRRHLLGDDDVAASRGGDSRVQVQPRAEGRYAIRHLGERALSIV